MDCSKILIKHYKQYRWRCGETYESLVWLEDTTPKPTEEELDLNTMTYFWMKCVRPYNY